MSHSLSLDACGGTAPYDLRSLQRPKAETAILCARPTGGHTCRAYTNAYYTNNPASLQPLFSVGPAAPRGLTRPARARLSPCLTPPGCVAFVNPCLFAVLRRKKPRRQKGFQPPVENLFKTIPHFSVERVHRRALCKTVFLFSAVTAAWPG